MTITVQFYSRISARLDNRLASAGSVEVPISFSIDGEKHEQVFSIANTANATVYSDDLGTFDFLYVASDFNTRMLITDSNSNTFSMQLRGTGTSGKYGIPFILALDETTDSSNTVTTIKVFNTSGSTAKVLVFVLD